MGVRSRGDLHRALQLRGSVSRSNGHGLLLDAQCRGAVLSPPPNALRPGRHAPCPHRRGGTRAPPPRPHHPPPPHPPLLPKRSHPPPTPVLLPLPPRRSSAPPRM